MRSNLNEQNQSENPFTEDTSDDPFDIDEPNGIDDGFGGEPRESTSKFCIACGTMTTVTDGEVRYCGNCGRELYSPPNKFPSLEQDYEFDFDGDYDEFDLGEDEENLFSEDGTL